MAQSKLADADLWPSEAWKQALRRRLLAWYRRHARDLPWRRTRQAYHVWVSEVMLQQTQAATVAAYFERFLAAFPTVEALAAAEEQQVLRHWEGLGYYRRARQLHQAAKTIVAEHGGQFPQCPAAARALPGVGRYTAGAVLSIAFDARQPILEANTVRLFCRLLGYRGDPASAAGQQRLWAAAEQLLPRRGCGDFNQAAMELGSRVCTPREPRCDVCPVGDLCAARAGGLQGQIPALRAKPAAVAVHEAAVVVRRRDAVLLVQRAEGERWAGLWEFPRFAHEGRDGGGQQEVLRRLVLSATGVRIGQAQPLATIRHAVTRFRVTLACYLAAYAGRDPRQRPERPTAWLPLEQLGDYPLNTPARRLARLVIDQATRRSPGQGRDGA
jgi:A/G-specific adenine glycosylase